MIFLTGKQCALVQIKTPVGVFTVRFLFIKWEKNAKFRRILYLTARDLYTESREVYQFQNGSCQEWKDMGFLTGIDKEAKKRYNSGSKA